MLFIKNKGGETVQKIRYNIILGRNIRNFRKAAKLTQEQVTAKMQLANCDITRSTYAKMEAGLANIPARDLVCLSQILDCNLADFFQGIQ